MSEQVGLINREFMERLDRRIEEVLKNRGAVGQEAVDLRQAWRDGALMGALIAQTEVDAYKFSDAPVLEVH